MEHTDVISYQYALPVYFIPPIYEISGLCNTILRYFMDFLLNRAQIRII